jgi:hypothetical protein
VNRAPARSGMSCRYWSENRSDRRADEPRDHRRIERETLQRRESSGDSASVEIVEYHAAVILQRMAAYLVVFWEIHRIKPTGSVVDL